MKFMKFSNIRSCTHLSCSIGQYTCSSCRIHCRRRLTNVFFETCSLKRVLGHDETNESFRQSLTCHSYFVFCNLLADQDTLICALDYMSIRLRGIFYLDSSLPFVVSLVCTVTVVHNLHQLPGLWGLLYVTNACRRFRGLVNTIHEESW